MKKIFFSLVALAAIAACSKSEVEYTDQVEISFAPVANNLTKSVAGVNTNGTHKQTFPTTQKLYIYAIAQDQNADGTFKDTWSTYLTHAEFKSDRINKGVYEGTDPYYWPNVKPLKFAGYSQACNSAELETEMNFTNNELTIRGYVQDNETYPTEGANDLMWFPCDGTSYYKATGTVSATMKHACSWITVKVIGDKVTGNNYLLKNLTINNLKHKGNVICKQITTTNEGQTTTSYNAEWKLDDDFAYTSSEVLYSNSDGAVFPKTGNDAVVFENYANNMIVLPQKPTSINVTYSYVPQKNVAAITEVVKDLDLKITEEATDAKNLWESGKHYVYTITITATEILIDPKVAKWDDVTVTTTPSI